MGTGEKAQDGYSEPHESEYEDYADQSDNQAPVLEDEYSQAEPSSEPVHSDFFNQPTQEAPTPHHEQTDLLNESEATQNVGLSKTSHHHTQNEDFASADLGQNKSDGITADARVSDYNQ